MKIVTKVIVLAMGLLSVISMSACSSTDPAIVEGEKELNKAIAEYKEIRPEFDKQYIAYKELCENKDKYKGENKLYVFPLLCKENDNDYPIATAMFNIDDIPTEYETQGEYLNAASKIGGKKTVAERFINGSELLSSSKVIDGVTYVYDNLTPTQNQVGSQDKDFKGILIDKVNECNYEHTDFTNLMFENFTWVHDGIHYDHYDNDYKEKIKQYSQDKKWVDLLADVSSIVKVKNLCGISD